MPKLEARVLHNKSIFDIGIVTPMENMEFFSFGLDQRRAKKYREGRVHKICNQSKFGSLSLGQRNWEKSDKSRSIKS